MAIIEVRLRIGERLDKTIFIRDFLVMPEANESPDTIEKAQASRTFKKLLEEFHKFNEGIRGDLNMVTKDKEKRLRGS